MNNSKIHYKNWQAFFKSSLEMNMERWNISSDLKMLHKHFPLQVLTKCKMYLIYYGNFPLRLYCLRISENLVVLFNGAEKTAATAQGGRTSMAFQEANIFAKRMLDALQQKEIYITTDQRAFRYYDGSDEIII
jgi:DNA-binding protein